MIMIGNGTDQEVVVQGVQDQGAVPQNEKEKAKGLTAGHAAGAHQLTEDVIVTIHQEADPDLEPLNVNPMVIEIDLLWIKYN